MAATGEARQHAQGFTWLADDTEESILGTMLHQEAIWTLASMLRQLRDEHGAGWGVATQSGIEGFTRPDGSAYTPMPDVFVHPRPVAVDIASITLAAYGPPWLVVEVASPTTVAADLGEKARTYARGGVAEYLVFDVGERLVPERVWARRLRPDGDYLSPWEPEADGRWHSTRLPLSFAPEGVLLRVYDAEGLLIPTDTEERQRRQHAEWQAKQEAQTRRQAEQRIAALEEELRRLRGHGG